MPSDRSKNDSLSVVPTGGGWTIKRAGSSQSMGVYESQAEATRAAQEKLRAKGGELKVQGRNGRWRESLTIGRNAVEKMNAVEGLYVSGEMQGAFRDFDQKGLSAHERRQAIARKFAKKS